MKCFHADHYLCKALSCSFLPHYGLSLSLKSHPSHDGLCKRFSAVILHNATLDSDVTTQSLSWFWSGRELALQDFVFHFLSLPDRRTLCPSPLSLSELFHVGPGVQYTESRSWGLWLEGGLFNLAAYFVSFPQETLRRSLSR